MGQQPQDEIGEDIEQGCTGECCLCQLGIWVAGFSGSQAISSKSKNYFSSPQFNILTLFSLDPWSNGYVLYLLHDHRLRMRKYRFLVL